MALSESSLANQLLIAMPSVDDPDLERTVIYLCEHHVEGSVGLIINRPMQYPLGIVFDQLQIEPIRVQFAEQPLLYGGPIQPERGFVIHRETGSWRSSLELRDDVTVTTSNDIIRAIAKDTGPEHVMVTLGYVGWETGHLEQEILNNKWLVCPYKPELLYDLPYEQRWEAAGRSIGVNMLQLNSLAGHA